MRKILFALVVAVFLSGCAMADSFDVGGSVNNTAPVVGTPTINASELDADDNIPIDATSGAAFWVIVDIADDNGFDTIQSADYELFNPSGTSIGTGAMNLLADPSDTHGLSGVAEVDLTLPSSAEAGTYSVTVTVADEEVSVSTTDSAMFTSNSMFSITPLVLDELVAGNTVSASFFVTMNYGAAGETVRVNTIDIGDLTVTKEGLADDVIPASAITANIPSGIYNVGEPIEVTVDIAVPYGTHGGSLSGTGTIGLETFV